MLINLRALSSLAAMVVAIAALASSPASASWSVAPGTVPSNTSALGGVTCINASACLLVGFQSGVASRALAANWNGSAFGALTPASTTSELYDAACGPTLCFAVGADYASGPSPHAEYYNGSTWTTTTAPAPSGATSAQLLGVSCPTSTACFAAGWYQTTTNDLPFVLRWNGTSWSAQALTLPVNTTNAKLADISCTSASDCTAVGFFEATGAPRRTLALKWNGTSWSPQTTANPAGAVLANFYGVECVAASACTAVGSYLDSSSVRHALAEGFNGTTWSLQAVPDPSGGAVDPILYDVSCSSASSCSAVGQYTTATPNTAPLAAAWNGTAWSLQSVPTPAGTSDNLLVGVSCPSTCMAVGMSTYDGSTGVTGLRPLVELGP